MGIVNIGRIAAVVLLAIAPAACNRSPQSKELSALENAYKSGVLTKAEYEGKRAALETQSSALTALDKALEAGVVTRDEYQARKAQWIAKAGALAALERARNAGVLTKDEYLAKRSALVAPDAAAPASLSGQEMASPAAIPAEAVPSPTSAGNLPSVANAPGAASLPAKPAGAMAEAQPQFPPPPQPQSEPGPPASQRGQPSPAPSSSAQGHVLRMKIVKAIDQHGFERPMPSASMLIPTDWQAQGATTWINDKCNGIQTSLRAWGPDGRAVEVFPAFSWVWADDPKPMQATAAQTAKYGSRPCEVMPPMSAGDFLRRNLNRYRPNAQVVGLEPAPKLMAILQQRARQDEQDGAKYNLKQRIRPDAVKGRVRYSVNGQAVEEWLVVFTITTGTLGPSFNARTMQMDQVFTYSCAAYVTGERAPQGQLDASDKFFDLVTGTYRWDPAWQAKVSGHAQAMQQIELKGVRDRSAIVTKNAEDMRNIQRQGYENAQQSADRISEQRSQTMRGVETYRNPSTGETVELSNQYGQAWVNNRGEYLLSDQPGFNPSVTLKEDWKALERVKQ
jgi:hypothetical protein